jgi:hypothetical protein
MRFFPLALLLLAFGCQKNPDPKPEPEPVCTADLTKGLIAYYPFNGNFNDESGNGNHATAMNGAGFGIDMFGRQSSTAKFDGVNDYLIVPGNPKLDSDSLTVSLNVMVNTINRKQTLVNRIKFDGATSHQWGIGQPISNENNYSFAVAEKTEECSKQPVYNPNTAVYSNVTTQAGKWYNIVCTFGKNGQRIYVNGVLVDSSARTFNTLKKCSAADLLIGGWWNGEIISIDGKIDDVRIYNRELAICEITELAKDAKESSELPAFCDPDLTKGLLAYYPFNGNLNDESGNGNNGIANGASLTTDFLGRAGKAISFDGIDDYVLINDNGKLNSDTVTVSMVVMVNNVNKVQAFLNRVSFTNALSFSYGLGQSLSATNRWDFGVGPNEGCNKTIVYDDAYYARSVEVMVPGRWYHLIGVFANGKQQLYVDGKLVSTLNRAFPKLLKCPGQQLVLGGWWQGQLSSMDGKMDDVRIYNRALGDCEIAKLTKIFKE